MPSCLNVPPRLVVTSVKNAVLRYDIRLTAAWDEGVLMPYLVSLARQVDGREEILCQLFLHLVKKTDVVPAKVGGSSNAFCRSI